MFKFEFTTPSYEIAMAYANRIDGMVLLSPSQETAKAEALQEVERQRASVEPAPREEAADALVIGIVGDGHRMDALDALARNDPPLQDEPITLEPIDHRRNLTVRGVPLNHLVGRRFRVGEVILRGGRLNFPCKYLENLLGMPVFLPLYNRSGLNCGIEKGGTIRPGDPIELLE